MAVLSAGCFSYAGDQARRLPPQVAQLAPTSHGRDLSFFEDLTKEVRHMNDIVELTEEFYSRMRLTS